MHARLIRRPLVASLLLSFSSSCLACLYFPEDFDQSFRETEREALLFRDPEDPSLVNLILKSSVEGKLPPEMAWVFPFPSKPLDYQEVDAAIFSELNDFTRSEKMTRSLSLGNLPAPGAIAVHEKEVVGNYELVPIEIIDPSAAGDELNAWLREQGYIELPPEIQRPYLHPGAVFLAIKVVPRGGSMELKPLRVKYRSDSMSFPLRFTHDYRTFDLNLYIVHGPDESVTGIPVPAPRNPDSDSALFARLAAGPTRPAPDYNPFEKTIVKLASLRDSDPASFSSAQGLLLGQPSDSVITRLALRGVNERFATKQLTQDPGVVSPKTPVNYPAGPQSDSK